VSGKVGQLIKYALSRKKEFDMFVVLSDNFVNPSEASEMLEEYREYVNPKAK
jgi:hypothetical protein